MKISLQSNIIIDYILDQSIREPIHQFKHHAVPREPYIPNSVLYSSIHSIVHILRKSLEKDTPLKKWKTNKKVNKAHPWQ